MLGLGNTLVGGAPSSEFVPTSLSGLVLWLKAGTGMSSNQTESGSAHTRSTSAGDIADTDRIHDWADQSDEGNDATQGTGADMPKWDTDASVDVGKAHWDSNVKYMDLDSTITIDANEDFTIIMRWKAHDLAGRTLIGHDTQNLFKIQSATDMRSLIGGSGVTVWSEGGGGTLVTTAYYTTVYTRSNGSTGDLNVYVNGGAHSDVDWDAAENATDADAFTISNLGSNADDAGEWKGHIADVLIYKGYALTSGDRDSIYTYIANQTQEQS